MKPLSNLRIAILATDGVEELELTEPLRALRMEGAQVDILSIAEGPIQAVHNDEETIRIHVDRVLGETVNANQYNGLVIPGGSRSVNALCADPRARLFVCEMAEGEKPIGALCHGALLLASATSLSGRRLTSHPELKEKLRAKGADWIDAEAVVHDYVVTSRSFADMPAFNREMIELLLHDNALISPDTRHVFSRNRIA